MAARDFFESIQRLQARIHKLESDIESAYATAGPHGQSFGSIGGGGGDRLAGVDRVIDSDAMRELDRAKARLYELLDRATDILYGESGNGGLAKARGSDDAYVLDLHYLQGIGWARMARYYVDVGDVADPADYLRIRARHAMRYIDRVGMDELAGT